MTKKHQVLRQLDSVTDMAAECINYFVYHPKIPEKAGSSSKSSFT